MQYIDIRPGQLFKIPDSMGIGRTHHTGMKLHDQKAVNLVTNTLISIWDQYRDFEILDAFLEIRFKT